MLGNGKHELNRRCSRPLKNLLLGYSEGPTVRNSGLQRDNWAKAPQANFLQRIWSRFTRLSLEIPGDHDEHCGLRV